MKTKEIILYIILVIVVIIVAVSYRENIKEVKQRYEVVQEEKEYLIKENKDLKQKLLEQDMQTNNKDTRE